MARGYFGTKVGGTDKLLCWNSATGKLESTTDQENFTEVAAAAMRDFELSTTSGAYTPDFTDGDFQRGTLTGDMTLTAPTTIPASGDALVLEITCGSFTLTVGADTYTGMTVIVGYYKSGSSVRVTVTEVTV